MVSSTFCNSKSQFLYLSSMKWFNYAFLAAPLLLSSCLSTQFLPNKPDSALMVAVQNRVVLSSLNSALQTTIQNTAVKNDTLVVTYRRGPFQRRDANSLFLPANINYLKCGGQLLAVKRQAGVVTLERQ